VDLRDDHVPWTKRRHHYTREELALSLTQTLGGYGPDMYCVQPAERVRFAVQLTRRAIPGPSILASVPDGSHRERRSLLAHGWTRSSVGRTRYFQRSFADGPAAAAAILEAYAVVYGAVGDDRGWNIVAPALRPRQPWREPWTGEETPIGNDLAQSPRSVTISNRIVPGELMEAELGLGRVFGVGVDRPNAGFQLLERLLSVIPAHATVDEAGVWIHGVLRPWDEIGLAYETDRFLCLVVTRTTGPLTLRKDRMTETDLATIRSLVEDHVVTTPATLEWIKAVRTGRGV
jgi:hypothetical protein